MPVHYHAATPDYTLHLTSSLTRPIEDYRHIMPCVQIRYDNKPLIAKVSLAFSMAMCSTQCVCVCVCLLILYWQTWINMMCKRAELEWRFRADTQRWCVLVLRVYVRVSVICYRADETETSVPASHRYATRLFGLLPESPCATAKRVCGT